MRLSKLLIVVLGSGTALILLKLVLPTSYTAERILTYLHGGWVISLCAFVAVAGTRLVSRRGTDSRIRTIGVFIILMYILDPYTHGYHGGHSGLQPQWKWQICTTYVLVILPSVIHLESESSGIERKYPCRKLLGGGRMDGV
jgi:hypothetical protein